tara:strand:+ start:208 stop:516 length:309 start_codon:yes stop_codon:yes gene_type:complete
MIRDTPTQKKMKTNDLKKGMKVLLRNGWEARIEDNRKGNTRLATVYGFYTEMGSVYSHDIVSYVDENGFMHDIEHTPAQEKLWANVARAQARHLMKDMEISL